MAPVYADHPFALIQTPVFLAKNDEEKDLFARCASEMACVHNMAIRGLNSIYLQAPHIAAKDEKAFCNYIHHWYSLLHVHHTGEEEDFFPALEAMTGEKGLMDVNVDQHHAFHDGMEAFHDYALAVLAGKEKYDGARVVALIDVFGQAITVHLSDEIPTLLGLRKFGEEKMQKLQSLFDAEGEKNMSKIGMFTGMPWCLSNMDLDFEGGIWKNWPPAPWIILWFCRNVAFWAHSDWWKFGAVDRQGNMRPLYAMPAEEAK